MGDGDRRSHMTPVQKTIAYSAIVIGGLAIGMAIGSSVHIAYYIFTSSGIKKTDIFQSM